ncbi:hypothetical protein DL95DRAFT_468086 [Leptodontidium sp. 2 PMI_412]|nr:hypothetical protein DL95DRAFT_468086 [Leptodontidium sp. 2 PMI_412]
MLLILALIASPSLAQTITRQTLYSLQSFTDLQPCAQKCIVDPGICRVGGVDQIAINVGCQYNWCSSDLGAAESCYCRTDLQVVATKYLTSCLRAACTLGDPNIELSSAVELYQGYCTAKGYLATPASVPASTTGTGVGATKTVYVTVTAKAKASHSYATALLLPILISVRAVDPSLFSLLRLSSLLSELASNSILAKSRASSLPGVSSSFSSSSQLESESSMSSSTPAGFASSTDVNSLPSSNPPTSSTANNGLSRADKIALGCGLGIPLATLIFGFLAYREQRKQRRAQENRGNRLEGLTSTRYSR